jgi:hypothetical protein
MTLPSSLIWIACAAVLSVIATAQPGPGFSQALSVKPSAPSPFKEHTIMATQWADGPCPGVRSLAPLNGKTQAALSAEFGPAAKRLAFRMGERTDEFRIVLQNHFPLSKPENAAIEIEEWTWTSTRCKLTVWFHRVGADWVSVENSLYSVDAEF